MAVTASLVQKKNSLFIRNKCIMSPWLDLCFQNEHGVKDRGINSVSPGGRESIYAKSKAEGGLFGVPATQGSPLKQHMHLLPSNSITLTKKTCFYPLCPWGLYTGLENQHSPSLTPHTLAHPCYIFPVCLSSLHIPSHSPSPISHLSLSMYPSPVSILSCFLFCPFLAVTYFSFSTISLSHIPASSPVACHHPGSHSSSPYHLLSHSFCDTTGPWCCSSLLLIHLFPSIHKHNFTTPCTTGINKRSQTEIEAGVRLSALLWRCWSKNHNT